MGRLAQYFVKQPVDSCLQVLQALLLGGPSMPTLVVSSSREDIIDADISDQETLVGGALPATGLA